MSPVNTSKGHAMKTSGICNAQSARKHRKMGHDVARRPDGRYSWVNTQAKLNRKFTPDYVADKLRQAQELIAPYKAAATATVDGRDFSALHVAGPNIGDVFGVQRANEIRRLEDLPVRQPERRHMIVVTVAGTTIRQGNQFWPKRRNQHSKPFEVLGFMAGTHDVMFRRVGSDTADSVTLESFEAMIGKRVEK